MLDADDGFAIIMELILATFESYGHPEARESTEKFKFEALDAVIDLY